MTPKEKAFELYKNMFEITESQYESKKCALISVDELINYSDEWDDSDYWQEVKNEINKL